MTDIEKQVREETERRQLQEDYANLKADLDTYVAEKVAVVGNLAPIEKARLQSFLYSCKSEDDRQAAEVIMVRPADVPSSIADGEVSTSAPKPTFKVCYGDEDDPESFEGQTRDSLADVYSRHKAVFEHVLATQDTVTAAGSGVGYDPAKPPTTETKEGQAALRRAFAQALEGTRVGEDKKARALLLSAAKDPKLLDELEIYTVARRRPGYERASLEDPQSYVSETEVYRWPEEPSLPRWDPADGTPPPAAPAFVMRVRTMRSLAAELWERERIRHYHGKDADELLAPRKPVFW